MELYDECSAGLTGPRCTHPLRVVSVGGCLGVRTALGPYANGSCSLFCIHTRVTVINYVAFLSKRTKHGYDLGNNVAKGLAQLAEFRHQVAVDLSKGCRRPPRKGH